MIKRFIACFLAVLFITMNLASCSNEIPYSINDCLGEVSYTSSISALVYEQIDGEEAGFKGIQYHTVTNLDGLINQKEAAVCLYFYNSYNTSGLGITAGVEDLAQALQGRVLFVAIDAFVEADISSAYQVVAYPDFILINNGARISTFGSDTYDVWYMSDVDKWLTSNGFEPDYSLLDY